MNLIANVGFEFEFSIDRCRITDIERKLVSMGLNVLNHRSYAHSIGSSWEIKTDSSCGWEIASPIIRTYEDLAKAADVADVISEAHGRVNSSCGFHVHVDMSGLNEVQRSNLMRFATRYEQAFFMMVPPYRRQNSFCKGYTPEQVSKIKRTETNNLLSRWDDKYVWLNLASYSRIGTVEFRLMPGTLNKRHIVGYIVFLQQLIKAIKSKKVCWGLAKGRDSRSIYQTMLGQAGFYGPFDDENHKQLCVIGRKWAIDCFKLSQSELDNGGSSEHNDQLARFEAVHQRPYSLGFIETATPVVEQPTARERRNRRSSSQTEPVSTISIEDNF